MTEQHDTNSVAFQYIRQQVAKDMAPLYAIFNKEHKMNERIKNLLMEARLFCYNDGTVSLPGETYAGQAEVQMFAELIVRECANAIANDNRLSDVKIAANGCVRAIKEHFGVEE